VRASSVSITATMLHNLCVSHRYLSLSLHHVAVPKLQALRIGRASGIESNRQYQQVKLVWIATDSKVPTPLVCRLMEAKQHESFDFG